MAALPFLWDKVDLERFKVAIRNLFFLSHEEPTELRKQYGMTDTTITSDGMKLANNFDFAGDDEFCDWVWVVDLDTGSFEPFAGFA